MTGDSVLVIAERFHGPKNSGNGGYVCGRLAEHIGPSARVRLRVPPPLDVPLEVQPTATGVCLRRGETEIAEGWAESDLELEVPSPPSPEVAEAASRNFVGLRSHRFPSCFVCGPERKPGDGLRIFAGPVPDRDIVACTWIPERFLGPNGNTVTPEFMWAALDCPGGFAFPHPQEGTILLGELRATIGTPASIGERHVIIGWEIEAEGRKHRTGTAIFSENGLCLGIALGIWLEVADLV